MRRVIDRLHDLRMPPAEFARRMKRSRGWATKFLDGTKFVPLGTLERMADVLGLDVVELIKGDAQVVVRDADSAGSVQSPEAGVALVSSQQRRWNGLFDWLPEGDEDQTIDAVRDLVMSRRKAWTGKHEAGR